MKRTTLVILIPAAMLGLAVAFSAVAGEKNGKAFLGVSPGEVTSDIASDYGVKAGGGIVVEKVAANSPADDAGLRENDIIVKLNGNHITGPEEFRRLIRALKPGDTVNVEYMRGGQARTVKVKLAEREDRRHGMIWKDDGRKHLRFEGMPWDWRWESGDDEAEHEEKTAFAGIVTQALSKGLAGYFKVEKGALISEVVKDSPAEKAGLKAGDVIVKIGGTEIEDEGDVRRAIREHKPGDVVVFVVMREGNQVSINVTLGENERRFGEGIHRIRVGDQNFDFRPEDLVPSPEEMERLTKELHQIEIELKALPKVPDLNINVYPEHDLWRVEVQRVETICHDGWKESLREFYDRLARKVYWLGKALVEQKERLERVGNRLIDALA